MELLHTFKKSYYLKMSADKHLIVQANSSQISIFENNTYRQLAQFKEVSNADVFFSADSRLLLAKDTERKLVVYDMKTMSVLCKLKPRTGSSNGDGEACISHDNKYVINLGYDFPYGYISVYDIESGKETRYREDKQEVYDHIRYIPSRRQYFITGFRRPQDKTDGKNSYFCLWFDMDNNRFEQIFYDLDNAEFIYAECLNQVFYVCQGNDSVFRIFPLDVELPLANHPDIMEVKLSHNNKMIALYQGKELKVCTFPAMKVLMTFPGIDYGRVTFSSDDKEILVASNKGFIYKID